MFGKKRTAAFSLVEMMVALGVGSLVLLALAAFSLFTARSLASIENYTDLDEQSQLALDKFCQQVRQVKQLSSYTLSSSNTIASLTFLDYDGVPLTFGYDPSSRVMTRTKSGVVSTFLTQCDSLQFQIFQRTVQAGSFDAFTTAAATNCKLVEVSWVCSRPLMQIKANTQSMQSAKVVIR